MGGIAVDGGFDRLWPMSSSLMVIRSKDGFIKLVCQKTTGVRHLKRADIFSIHILLRVTQNVNQ